MNLKNKKVLVIGLAKSGLAAIRLLKQQEAIITLTEKKDIENIKKQVNDPTINICKQEMAVFEADYDLVIKNPGVPIYSPEMNKLRERNIPVITEIELSFQLMKKQHIIAITGTNGKTTTTTMTYEILKKAYGDKAHLCGNVGTPLCDIVVDYDLLNNEGHYLALEISNAQLANIDKFKADISVIINLTPDHIDFMGGLDNYYKSKTEVYRNSSKDDLFLLNVDDEVIKEYTDRYPIPCQIRTFSLEKEADSYLKENYLYILGEKLLDVNKIHLVGKHNLQNTLIAATACKESGVSSEDIKEAVYNFKAVEHRIEFVREINGVKYYNDSKGTNTDATITALNSFEKGVILLVGGFEKGLPMDEMRKHLSCVKEVIGFGLSGPRIANDLVGDKAIVVKDLPEAVEAANKLAVSGDIILLSPTTSSFDQYSSYEERGRHFKEIVNNL